MHSTEIKGLHAMKGATQYNNWLYSQMKPYLKGNILEIGAGIGNFSKHLAKRSTIVATDINPIYLTELKKTVKGKNRVGYADIEKGQYFFNKEKFDTVVCLNVIEHIKDDKKALINIKKLLNKNGRLLLLVPSHMWAFGSMDKNISHFRRYEKNDLVKVLIKLKFKIELAKRLNLIGIIGWLINGRVLKREVVQVNQIRFFDLISAPFLTIEKFVEPPIGLSILMVVKKT